MFTNLDKQYHQNSKNYQLEVDRNWKKKSMIEEDSSYYSRVASTLSSILLVQDLEIQRLIILSQIILPIISIQNRHRYTFSLLFRGVQQVCGVAMTPIGVLSNPQNMKCFNNMNFKYLNARQYQKIVKPEISSLYSWFLVQNYLLKYTESIRYKENSGLAFLRYGIIGFLSMSAFDTLKMVLSQNLSSLKLPSQFVLNKTFVKGLHGVIFCTSTQFLKQQFESNTTHNETS